MVPRKKKQGGAASIMPPINPNSQLPFYGNYTSFVSEYDLLYLVEIGILPSNELFFWRIWQGVTMPMEDTHVFVVFVPFLIWPWVCMFPHFLWPPSFLFSQFDSFEP